jgi:hypothetical protein
MFPGVKEAGAHLKVENVSSIVCCMFSKLPPCRMNLLCLRPSWRQVMKMKPKFKASIANPKSKYQRTSPNLFILTNLFANLIVKTIQNK